MEYGSRDFEDRPATMDPSINNKADGSSRGEAIEEGIGDALGRIGPLGLHQR